MKSKILRQLPRIEVEEYEHKFINHIALFQVLIVSFAHPTDGIEVFMSRFGTDNWLKVFEREIETFIMILLSRSTKITKGEQKKEQPDLKEDPFIYSFNAKDEKIPVCVDFNVTKMCTFVQ